ncbi:MAG: hypothetical protein JXA50_10620 [Deltaproteobacteria bacterium]|nr:hypothetical protein [Deltaproteobacteria bacterium]
MGVLKRCPATYIQIGKAKVTTDLVVAEGSYELYLNDMLAAAIVVSSSELKAT